MPLVITDLGARDLLAWMLIDTVSSGVLLHCHLFTNDYTPDETSDVGDFTELVATGYSAKDVERANWSAPATVDGKATSAQPSTPWSWTNVGSDQTVYGYFVTNEDDDEVWWAERWASPRTVHNGDELEWGVQMTLRTDPGP